MKILTSTILLAVGLAVGSIGWYRWDSSRNCGSEFGYYGEYNRVSNALASIPGVVITQHWHNLDVTLEEFGFDLTIARTPIRLFFGEKDTIRSMSREAAMAALKQRIAAEIIRSDTK